MSMTENATLVSCMPKPGDLCRYNTTGEYFRIYKYCGDNGKDALLDPWFDTVRKKAGYMFIFIGLASDSIDRKLLGLDSGRVSVVHTYQILTEYGMRYIVDDPESPFIVPVELT